MVDAPVLAGSLAALPLAREFAEVVRRVHHRYATEVVGAFALCPFMNDPESAFGRFCVVLERELDVPTATGLVLAAPGVVHLVYPLFEGGCHEMERFGNAVHEAVRRGALAQGDTASPVHATFHPAMEGDTTTPHRAVGLVRRAPDAFLQFVPPGLTAGGSQFIDPATLDLAALLATPSKKRSTLTRLTEEDLASIVKTLQDVRDDRCRSYARFLDAFA